MIHRMEIGPNSLKTAPPDVQLTVWYPQRVKASQPWTVKIFNGRCERDKTQETVELLTGRLAGMNTRRLDLSSVAACLLGDEVMDPNTPASRWGRYISESKIRSALRLPSAMPTPDLEFP